MTQLMDHKCTSEQILERSATLLMITVEINMMLTQTTTSHALDDEICKILLQMDLESQMREK